MSESIDIDIGFDVCFCSGHLRTFLLALQTAIDDNWRRFADEWSNPAPSAPVLVDAWMSELSPERINRLDFEGRTSYSQTFEFSFSPVSCYVATLFVLDKSDSSLSVLITVPRSIVGEVQGRRERLRMEEERNASLSERGESPLGWVGPDNFCSDPDGWMDRYYELGETEEVWPEVRAGLIHIVEVLRGSLSVRQLSISATLFEG